MGHDNVFQGAVRKVAMDDDPADASETPGTADASETPGTADAGAVETGETDTGSADATDADDATDVATHAAADANTEATADSDIDATADSDTDAAADVPQDVKTYKRFSKMDGAQYDRVNEFLRDRTYITAREWAIARLCADFRTETGVEMTKIGNNLPRLVPFMTDTYSPQAVNQARSSFEGKITKSGATFLYGAMSGFFTAEELDELMYEVTEIAKFLLEVEGVDLAVAEELEAEERISSVMREVRQQSAELRGEEVECPECGHKHTPDSSSH